MPEKEKVEKDFLLAKRYLTVEEVAQKLSVPITKIYRMTREKAIPFYKIGKYCRFQESEIDDWMESMRA